jgi:membrane protease YdiL (CAAX protease family)
MRKIFFIFLVAAFLFAEIILTFNETLGVLLYALLVGLILFDLEDYEHLIHSDKLLVFLAIVPIARIGEFFIDFNFFWKAAVFYFAISFLVIYYTRSLKINPGYKTGNLWFFPLSIIIGIALSYIGSLYFGFEKNFELIFILPFIVFSEEILFRGMIQNYAKKSYGSLFAIITTSILFAIFSLSFGFKFSIFMFAANLIMCLIYDQTENIWLTIPINLCINLFLFVIVLPIL